MGTLGMGMPVGIVGDGMAGVVSANVSTVELTGKVASGFVSLGSGPGAVGGNK